MKLKQLFIDLETTGLNPDRHGIHQLAGSIRINGIEAERFEWKVQPHSSCDVDPVALKTSGIIYNTLGTYPMFYGVHAEFMKLLERHKNILLGRDKFHLAGYNSGGFDGPFLRRWVNSYHPHVDRYGEYFYNATHDVMVLAAERLKKVRHEMPGFSLGDVAAWLGLPVDPEQLHNAAYDILLTEQVYDLLTQ